MMKIATLKTYYTPEEAYSILMLLDELRDTIWHNYREDIIEYASKQQTVTHHQAQKENREEEQTAFDFDDDIIPF